MSDHDATPDPMDQTYVQAEALLSEEDARATRRARTLAAVARERAAPAAPPAAAWTTLRRSALQRGGWLAAAGVAGLSVVLAAQLRQLTPRQQPSASIQPAASRPAAAPQPPAAATPRAAARHATPIPSAPRIAAARTPAAPAATLAPAPRAFPAAPPAAATIPGPPPADVPAPPPLPIPPARVDQPKYQVPVAPVAVPSPPSPPAPPLQIPPARLFGPIPPAPDVGAQQRSAFPAANYSDLRSGGAADTQSSASSNPAWRLRAAAAAGRTAEVKALLAQGVPVDAADVDGDTALMKSIQADHPAVAALLRRHGARLDLTNRAGESARDMAMAKGDARLDRVIGLEP